MAGADGSLSLTLHTQQAGSPHRICRLTYHWAHHQSLVFVNGQGLAGHSASTLLLTMLSPTCAAAEVSPHGSSHAQSVRQADAADILAAALSGQPFLTAPPPRHVLITSPSQNHVYHPHGKPNTHQALNQQLLQY